MLEYSIKMRNKTDRNIADRNNINSEHLAVEILNMVGVILAICIGKRNGKIKSIALLQVLEVLFKGVESVTYTCKKGKRLFAGCLLNLLALFATM